MATRDEILKALNLEYRVGNDAGDSFLYRLGTEGGSGRLARSEERAALDMAERPLAAFGDNAPRDAQGRLLHGTNIYDMRGGPGSSFVDTQGRTRYRTGSPIVGDDFRKLGFDDSIVEYDEAQGYHIPMEAQTFWASKFQPNNFLESAAPFLLMLPALFGALGAFGGVAGEAGAASGAAASGAAASGAAPATAAGLQASGAVTAAAPGVGAVTGTALPAAGGSLLGTLGGGVTSTLLTQLGVPASIANTIGLIGNAATLASTVAQMRSGGNVPQVQAPLAPPAPQNLTQAGITPERIRSNIGRGGGDPTLLTGPRGLGDDTLTLGKVTLLGS